MADLVIKNQVDNGMNTPMIDLSANENPLGPSPLAIRAIEQALNVLHRYPEKDGDPLRDALAQQQNLDRSQLLLGNGATELLEFAARSSLGLQAQAEALIATPCFIPYHRVIQRAVRARRRSARCAAGSRHRKHPADHSRHPQQSNRVGA